MNASTKRTGEVSSLNFQHCYDAGKVSLAKTDAHNTPTPFMPDGYAIDTFLNCLFKIIYPTSLTLGVPATLSLLSAPTQQRASKRRRISKRGVDWHHLRISWIGNFKPVTGTDAPNCASAFFLKVLACPSQIPNRNYGGLRKPQTLGTRS